MTGSQPSQGCAESIPASARTSRRKRCRPCARDPALSGFMYKWLLGDLHSTSNFTTTWLLCGSCVSHGYLSPTQIFSMLPAPWRQGLCLTRLCIPRKHLRTKSSLCPPPLFTVCPRILFDFAFWPFSLRPGQWFSTLAAHQKHP